MEHKYSIGDMLYNNQDKTYNLVLEITRTPSMAEGFKFLYTYLDLGLGTPRKEFTSLYEKRTVRVP